MMPRVSVIVPTRDRCELLARALAGIDAQGFRDFEIVVVDDGSTDSTAGWLRAGRPDVRLVATRHAGAAAARNAGLRQALGEFVAFLDDDDLWHPDYLGAQVAHLDANADAAASYADHVEVDAAGRCTRPGTESPLPGADPLLRLLASCFVHTMSAIVCRRESFEHYGQFDERLAIVHDLDWYARVLAAGGDLIHLPRTLVQRSLPGGLVTARRRWFAEERVVIARTLADRVARDRRRVSVCRSLYFAKLAFASGDVGFGAMRLAEALAISPSCTVLVAARRLLRNGSWAIPADALQ